MQTQDLRIKADDLYQRENYEEAGTIYQQLAKLDPSDFFVNLRLGRLDIRRHDQNRAIARLNNLQIPPNLALEQRLELASFYADTSQFEKSKLYFFSAWREKYSMTGENFDVIQYLRQVLYCDQPSFDAIFSFIPSFSRLLSKILEDARIDLLSQNIIHELLPTLGSNPKNYFLLLRLQHAINFDKNATDKWCSQLYTHLFLPLFNWLLARECYAQALYVESIIYNNYVKKIETETHFATVFGDMAPAWEKAIEKIGKAKRPLRKKTTFKVGFFLHSPTHMAHTEVLLNLFRGRSEYQGKDKIQMFVFLCGKPVKTVETCLRKNRIQWYDVSRNTSDRMRNRDFSKTSDALEKIVNKLGCDALIFVSKVIQMPYLFAKCSAPLNIWWTMKYHRYSSSTIDERLANGSFEQSKSIAGQSWKVIHSAISFDVNAKSTKSAQKVRAQLSQFDTVFGCLGREEKIRSPGYLRSVSNILKHCPNSVFIWSGQSPLKEVIDFFTQEGVINRTGFVGWVDTVIYNQVIDIYIDSFPFPGGHTVFESMYLGKPVVMRQSIEAEESGVAMHILPALCGNFPESEHVKSIFKDTSYGSLFLYAATDDEYVNLAIRLEEDKNYRKVVGDANKAFVREYVCNPLRQYTSFHRHMLDIFEQRSASADHA